MSDRVTRSSSRLQTKTRSVSQPPVDKTKGRVSKKPSTFETPRPNSRVRSSKFKEDPADDSHVESAETATTTISNTEKRVTRSRAKLDPTPRVEDDEEDEIPLDIRSSTKSRSSKLKPSSNETPSKKSNSKAFSTPSSSKTTKSDKTPSVTPNKNHSNASQAFAQAGNSSDSDSDDAPEEVSGQVARREAIGKAQSEQRGRKLATEKKKEVNRLRTQQQQDEAQKRKKKTPKKETGVDRLPQELLAELLAEVAADEKNERKKQSKQSKQTGLVFGSDFGEEDDQDGLFGDRDGLYDDDEDDDIDSEDNSNHPYPSITKGPVTVMAFDRMAGINPAVNKAKRLQAQLEKHNARGRNRQPSRAVIRKGRPGSDFLKRDFSQTSVRLSQKPKKQRRQ